MAKDKTPNRTLRMAIDMKCQLCNEHGVVTKSVDGIVRRRCIGHLSPARVASTDYMLKFLNLV